MNKDEIAQMMQDSAGNSWGTEAHFQRFAALVAAAERAACIEAVEKSRVIEFVVYPKDYLISRNDVPRCYDFQHARSMEAIRARSKQ